MPLLPRNGTRANGPTGPARVQGPKDSMVRSTSSGHALT